MMMADVGSRTPLHRYQMNPTITMAEITTPAMITPTSIPRAGLRSKSPAAAGDSATDADEDDDGGACIATVMEPPRGGTSCVLAIVAPHYFDPARQCNGSRLAAAGSCERSPRLGTCGKTSSRSGVPSRKDSP